MSVLIARTNVDKTSVYQVSTLGHFNVCKDGQSLLMASSGSKKIWELFKFMLTHRDRAFTPDELLDQLWVSEEYSDPKGTLRRQMFRLRQALGEENTDEQDKTILFSNGYYRWNTQISIQIDIVNFEELIKEGDSVRISSPRQALDQYLMALRLYGGDYLSDCIEHHWAFSVRNHYRRLYTKTVLESIELLKSEGMIEDILQLCHEAIKIDIYEETYHLSLIKTLLLKGDQRQALEHYEYITEFYEKELGIKPSEEMKILHKRVLMTQEAITTTDNLYHTFEGSPVSDNAYYCEPVVFKSIYELECRRSERSGELFSIGVLTLPPLKVKSFSHLENKMHILKQNLLKNLRRGDSFTRWNDNQFVVMLPGVDQSLTEVVLKRILNINDEDSGVTINQITHLPSTLMRNDSGD